jgi:Ca2+-binding EF-hand superfamily protein
MNRKASEVLWTRILAADADQDGAISIAELAAFHPKHEHGPRGDLFAQFDADEDGLLTADEVTERLWTKLSQADANDDGAVSVAELADFTPVEIGHGHPGGRREGQPQARGGRGGHGRR